MAKSSPAAKSTGPKEAGQPVVISLVFFVLLAIGLGVFSYTLYSKQGELEAAKAKAEGDLKNQRGLADEADLTAKAYRVYLGVGSPEDLSAVAGSGDKTAKAVEDLRTAVKAQAGTAAKKAVEDWNQSVAQLYRDAARKDATPPKLDLSALSPDGLGAWADAAGAKGGAGGLVAAAAQQEVLRNLAINQANADQAAYNAARVKMAEFAAEYEKSKKNLDNTATTIPATFDKKVKEIAELADKRGDTYKANEKQFRDELSKLTDDISRLGDEKRALENDIKTLNSTLKDTAARLKPADPLQYDEPQGKVLRRLPDNLVEIDLGSAARVKPGLVFTVLPSDFPEKGRGSRVLAYRESDGRGGYKTVQRFTPKATVEVIDVLGPNLSRARITGQADDIRDRLLEGDLLYNAVWRKGQADHVALVGIFDLNGDGTDDIEAVVKDLTNMGVTVDAWFNLRTLKWEGKLTELTRYVVAGYTPTGSAGEANREARQRIIGGIAAAKEEAQKKAVAVVNFRDFFGRMGYKARGDVSEDRVNQAASRYYAGVGTVEAPKGKD